MLIFAIAGLMSFRADAYMQSLSPQYFEQMYAKASRGNVSGLNNARSRGLNIDSCGEGWHETGKCQSGTSWKNKCEADNCGKGYQEWRCDEARGWDIESTSPSGGKTLYKCKAHDCSHFTTYTIYENNCPAQGYDEKESCWRKKSPVMTKEEAAYMRFNAQRRFFGHLIRQTALTQV